MRTNVSRALRALRKRRGWRQAELGRRAGLSRDFVHRAENDLLGGMTIGSLGRLVTAAGGTLVIEVRWRGAELDQLIDRMHARIASAASLRLQQSGWLSHAEVSFNHYGDRGRCDLVAWHPATRTLLIVEVKSQIGNLQEALGRLDVKVRLGHVIAQGLGLGVPTRVVGAFVVLESGTSRRIVRQHDALLRRYALRGRSAFAWLRHPGGSSASGLLWFESPDVS